MGVRAGVIALAVVLATACGDRAQDEADDGSGGRVAGGPLPAPAGTAGGSVTGMPTSPPPAREVAAAEPVPADAGETLPVDPAADPNAIPIDPATGLAAGSAAVDGGMATSPNPPLLPGDATAAGAVVREYVAALSAGTFAAAQQLWSATPTDSAVLQLARGPAFAVDVLAPIRSADPAAAGVVTVPVRARGTAEDGSERGISAIYTVRRTAEGQWRIASASIREEAP
jgi:hypothetical protein